MINNLLKTRRARHLVYLLCTLMLLGGQPLMALQENVRLVPREDRPDWLEPWLEAESYRDAWTSTSRWAQAPMGALQDHLVSWWDGTWETSWDLIDAALAKPTGPRFAAAGVPAAPGQVPIFAAVSLGQVEESEKDAETFSEDKLRKLAETDALGSKKKITKATPLPNAPGLKAGASEFRPPKELIQLMAGKANLERTPLIPGWNLLSTPEEPANTDPAAVLAPIAGAYTRAYVLDNCDTADPWKVYDPNDPAASDLTVLDHTKGFWLEATSAVDLPSDGTLPATTTIQICPGWNLIGYPAAQPRHVTNALHTIEGKYLRVFSFEASDADDPWEVYGLGVPEWANDMSVMVPGRGYWVLATEATTLTIANEGPDPIVEITSPADLGVVTDFTDIVGTIQSPILDSWRLTYERIGETEPVEIASGVAPVTEGVLGTFDPTLLINGLYELKLEATDLDGRVVKDTIAVPVEGNMKIGHFTLSFVDLAIPLSGLDIEIIRTYDSRQKDELLDFGYGWSLDIRQGSYQNNRPPGDGWQIVNPGGPFGLPCTSTIETKSHLTTVRLSDQEIYRFRLSLTDKAALIGGCQARAVFDWVDGPLPGTTLDVLGNDLVIYENESDRLLDQDSFAVFEPGDVKLTTRDGRIFHLDLATGVTHLEDLNGNAVDITVDGISHSSGVGIAFLRDAEGRIQEIVDLRGNSNVYSYNLAGDLVQHADRRGAATKFDYRDHYLEDIRNALGVRAIRSEYDADGRLVRHIDAEGEVIDLSHELDQRQEVVTNRLGQSRLLAYDARGNVIREIDEIGSVTERTFDEDDNLLTEKDPLGRVTTYTYTPDHDLASISNALGETHGFAYTGRSSVLKHTDSLGRVTEYIYDSGESLLRIVDTLNQTTEFSYDASGNLVNATDALGETALMTFDSSGNLLSEIDALGHNTEFSYDEAGNRLTESHTRTLLDGSTESLVATFLYDELDRVIQTTAADGTSTQTTYDVLGRVTSRIDELERVMFMRYDPQGRLVETIFPGGTAESRTYDAEGRVLTLTDRADRVARMAYDATGRLLSTTFADGSTRSHVYDAVGQLVSVTDALGNSTSYTYDLAGRTITVRDALDQVSGFSHDANGNQTASTDARGNRTESSYDESGRLTTTSYADGSSEEFGYDALGRLVEETDRAGLMTHFGYDALGRMTTVTDALDQATSYTYDELGNRLTQTDALGRVVSCEYDQVGRQTARISPDGARETMTYRPDGTLATHTDLAGQTRTFEYDLSQRLTRRAYSDGTEHLFSYTPTGQRQSATDGRGVTNYTYDSRDRLLKKQDPNEHRLSYAYDAQGNLTTLTATVGGDNYVTSYAYDALNRIGTITDPDGGISSQAYDPNGNLIARNHANGAVTTYTYDVLNRLTLLKTRDTSSNVIQSHTYILSPTGHRSQITEADGATRSYQRDSLYRLTQDRLVGSSGDLEYQHDFSYDPVGNRLSQLTDEGSGASLVTSSYDSRDRLLTSGSTTYAWNASGSMIQRGAESFAWDQEQRLISAASTEGTVVETVYDVDGNRVQTRVVDGETTETIDYLVDTRGPLSHVVVQIQEGRPSTYFTRANDELITFHRAGVLEQAVFHTDGLGSVRAITGADQSILEKYDYSAFGMPTAQGAGTPIQPYGFAGEPYDEVAGLYYNRARWLQPESGRFVSTDPYPGSQRNPISLHRYVYAGLQPTVLVDPTGLIQSAAGAAQVSALSATLSSLQVLTIRVVLTVPTRIGLFLAHGAAGALALRSHQALMILRGTGPAGVRAWQQAVLRLQGPISRTQSLASRNWGSFSGFKNGVNRLLQGARTNPQGIQWHHIVEQHARNAARFGTNAINSVANVVPTPTSAHRAITGFYRSKPDWVVRSGYDSVRAYVESQSWEEQYRIGLEIWKQAMQSGQITWIP